MISMDKKYRTRDGREVRLLCVDGPPLKPVVGMIESRLGMWHGDGSTDPFNESSSDLIEYHEPDIRTIWVNVYEDGRLIGWSEKINAERGAMLGATISIAQPVTFEVKRG